MNFFTFTKLCRTLLLAAVVAVGSVCWLGCGGDDESSGEDDNSENNTVVKDTFTDSRDEKVYTSVKIGGQTWMAENLNYQTASDSWCYDNDPANCKKYGRLYTWNAANTACPSGWHLPSRIEWGTLAKAAGGTGTYGGGGSAGTKLKSKNGWSQGSNGTDNFGFSALPGGFRRTDGVFRGVGNLGYWWTATESGSSFAYFRDLESSDESEDYGGKGVGNSLRCVKND